MALFQPFKPTTRRPSVDFIGAAMKQGQLDQQQQMMENQARNSLYGGATDLGVGMYGEYKDPDSPIGEYLRNMGGGEEVAPLPATDARMGEDTEMYSPSPDGAPMPDEGAYSPNAGLYQDAPMSGDYSIQSDVPVGGPEDAPAPPMDTGSRMAPIDYSPPEGLGLETAEAGAEEAATDESLRGTLEGLFDQFTGGATLGAGELVDAGMADVGTDLATEAGAEAATEEGAEAAAEAAGTSIPGGLGSIMSLAQGDVKGAAAKAALSMLPPPYNMLAMLV